MDVYINECCYLLNNQNLINRKKETTASLVPHKCLLTSTFLHRQRKSAPEATGDLLENWTITYKEDQAPPLTN